MHWFCVYRMAGGSTSSPKRTALSHSSANARPPSMLSHTKLRASARSSKSVGSTSLCSNNDCTFSHHDWSNQLLRRPSGRPRDSMCGNTLPDLSRGMSFPSGTGGRHHACVSGLCTLLSYISDCLDCKTARCQSLVATTRRRHLL